MARILVVEDNQELAFGLTTTLEIEGHVVVVANTGPAGVEQAVIMAPDLVLLDLMLPGYDGFRVLRTIREAGCEAPVLILSARGEQDDKVRGFRLGADDYVTKPFGAMELLARVDALLRRHRPAPPPALTAALSPATPSPATPSPAAASPESPAQPVPSAAAVVAAPGEPVVHFGDTEILPNRRLVRRRGEVVALTPKAFDLLMALVACEGAVVSRRTLLENVWGYDASITTRTVDLHIVELRRKLEDDSSDPKHILTVWKVGYRLER
ncbi:MAG: response regulator transcription factor [Gemmatimonadota bacterium]